MSKTYKHIDTWKWVSVDGYRESLPYKRWRAVYSFFNRINFGRDMVTQWHIYKVKHKIGFCKLPKHFKLLKRI